MMGRGNGQGKLTQYDLMVIRAGGRTQAEFESMAESGFGYGLLRKVCVFLAAKAQQVLVKARGIADRRTNLAKHPLSPENGARVDGPRIG